MLVADRKTPLVEVELKVFIDESTYGRLLKEFSRLGKLIEDTRQITHYLDHPMDTRVQISRDGGKIAQKTGWVHDEARHELEIKMSRTQAKDALKIFKNIGIGPKISWFRHRLAYQISRINVMLDNTVGYGMILEPEIMAPKDEIAESKDRLKNFLFELGLAASPKDVFEKAFREYSLQWRERTQGLDESWLDEGE